MQRALFAGDKKTGVSIMQMDKGLDTGAVYRAAEVEITEQDDLGSLSDKLLKVATTTLLETLPLILNDSITPILQSADEITYANKWEKRDASIDWSEPAEVTLRRIRVCSPDLGAGAVLQGKNIKIYSAHLVQDAGFKWLSAGAITEVNKSELIVCAGTGDLEKQFIAIDKLQFPGKPARTIKEILNGYKFTAGERFE
jgi:methionyl-tRNA formyltransferase